MPRKGRYDERPAVTSTAEASFVQSPVPQLVAGLDLRLTLVNEALTELLGRDAEHLIGHQVDDFASPEDPAGRIRELVEPGSSGHLDHERLLLRGDGSVVAVRLVASLMRDAAGIPQAISASLVDLSAQRAAEADLRGQEALRRHALYDDLTGLPNRTLLEDRLEQATDRRVRGGLTSVTATVLDVDDFSLVNAELGHAAGDRVLEELAQRLSAARRPGDTLARFAADEFVVVSEDLSRSETAEVAHHLQAQVALPFRVGERELHLTASIGVATSPGCPSDELLRTAHAALESARARGRGLVEIIDEGVTTHQAPNERGAAADLRRALANDELTLHYQPVVELSSGRLLGLEALARWQPDQRGSVPPAVLVAAAEQTGLAPQLDAWALQTATAALAELRADRRVADDVYVTVNISAQHLTHGELVRAVDEALAASGLPADRLGLELAETAVLTDSSPGCEVLERIADRGVTIALDNFGTGYSSLAHLRRLPVARVKIDRMFVEKLPHDVDDLAMVASVLELARAVRVDTVAVGVSTAEQADVMARLDCHGAQGALWSEPVALAALVQQLAAEDGPGAARVPQPRPDAAVRAPEAVRASREHGLHRLLALHQSGASLRSIAAALNSEGFRTPVGSRWHPTSVASVIADHAYPSLWARAGD